MPMVEDLLKNLGVAETWLTSNIRWPIFKLRLYKHNFRCSRVWESRLSRIWTKKVTQSISQGGEACQGSFQTPGRGGIWEITKIIFGHSECSSLITTFWTIVTTKRRLILCWIGVTNLSSVVLFGKSTRNIQHIEHNLGRQHDPGKLDIGPVLHNTSFSAFIIVY